MLSGTIIKAIGVVIAAFSQILLKISANKEHSSRIKEYINIDVVLAYMLFVISTLFTIIALRRISVSSSAILESINYVLVPTLSFLILKEKLNKTQILGMIIILFGVIINYL